MQFQITTVIIIITVVVSFYTFNKPTVMARLMMNPWTIKRQNQYERFVTSGVIHKDHMHLLTNMFTLYFLGRAVESDFLILFGDKGAIYYILLYVLAIIVSDLPTYLKQQNNPAYNSLGASGGVAAIVFAFILLEPIQDLCLFGVICFPGFIFGTAYIIYSYFSGKNSRDNINHDAHLYGALFGMVFCIILHPSSLVHFVQEISHWHPSFF